MSDPHNGKSAWDIAVEANQLRADYEAQRREDIEEHAKERMRGLSAICARCGETRACHHMGGQEHVFEDDSNDSGANQTQTMTPTYTLHVYRSHGQWRWRVTHRNGRKIANGGESYQRISLGNCRPSRKRGG